MPGFHGRAPGRRLGVAVLLGLLAIVSLMVAGVSLLVPAGETIVDDAVAPTSSCAEPQLGRVPIPVRSGVVLACPELFDGRLVRIEGEAVGDLFNGPSDRQFVLLNDDAYARLGPLTDHGQVLGTNSGLAVLLPTDVRPTLLGGPGISGDVLRVIGVFEAAAEVDQGGPTVVAEAVVTVHTGRRVGHASSVRLQRVTPLAVIVTLGLGGLLARRRARLFD